MTYQENKYKNFSGEMPNDMEFTEEGEALGLGKHAHMLHRMVEGSEHTEYSFDIDLDTRDHESLRELTGETLNRMLDYLDPEHENYGALPEDRKGGFPVEREVEKAARELDHGFGPITASHESMKQLVQRRLPKYSEIF